MEEFIKDAKSGNDEGRKNGKTYELLCILHLLNTNFTSRYTKYAIANEINIGRDEKFSDVAFSYYEGDDHNLIMCQVKHKANKSINTSILTSRAAFGNANDMVKSFNLQQYFISFMDIEIKLENIYPHDSNWKYIKGGTLKYVVIFTNVDLDINELKENEIVFKEAPKDIKEIFNIKDECSWQIESVGNDKLKTVLKESSDLEVLARELARYAIKYEKTNIEATRIPFCYYYYDILKHIVEEAKYGDDYEEDTSVAYEEDISFDYEDRSDAYEDRSYPYEGDTFYAYEGDISDAYEDRSDAYEDRFDAYEDRFDAYEDRFDAYEDRFDIYEDRFDAYEDRFDTYEDIFDAYEGDISVDYEEAISIAYEEDASDAYEDRIDAYEDKFDAHEGDKFDAHEGDKFDDYKKEIKCESNDYFIGKFKETFIINKENLNSNVRKLRLAMLDHIRKFQNKDHANSTCVNFDNRIKTDFISCSTCKYKTKSDEEIIEEIKKKRWNVRKAGNKMQHTVFPENWKIIEDGDIQNFFNKFVFIVKQPMVKCLLDNVLNSLEENMINDSGKTILEKMKNKIKIDKIDKEKDRWINDFDYEAVLKTTAKCSNAIAFCSFFNYIYEYKVKKYGLELKVQTDFDKKLNNFLRKRKNPFKILHIFTSSISLTSIKLIQYFKTEKFKQYKIIPIALELSEFNNKDDTIEFVLEGIKTGIYDLLILEYKNEGMENFYNFYKEVNKKMKLIIISKEEQNDLTKIFAGNLKDTYSQFTDVNVDFSHFSENSQIKLLRKEISFNAHPKGKTLQEILDLKEKFEDKEAESLNTALNSEAINQLVSLQINKSKIILENLYEYDAIESNFYSTFEFIDKNVFAKVVQDNDAHLFVICGIQREYFRREYESIDSFVSEISSIYSTSHEGRIILLNIKDENEISSYFKYLCYKKCYKKFKRIHLFDIQNNQLFWKQSYDSSLYISRQLRGLIIDKSIVKDNPNDIFAISAKYFDKNLKKSLATFLQIETYLISSYDEDNINVASVIILNDLKQDKDFNELCMNDKLTQYNIHWIIFDNKSDNKLVWKSSKFGAKLFCDSITKERYEMSESEFVEIINSEKAILITDEPGMGKSTTLVSLIRQMDDGIWNIKIDLIVFNEQLKKIKKIDYSSKNIVEFIANTFASTFYEGEQTHIAKAILHYRLIHQGKIALWFDGFDEIQLNKTPLLQLLVYLKDHTKARIIVTSRNHEREILEENLRVLAYSLTPLEQNNQEEYLQIFWKLCSNFDVNCSTNHNELQTKSKILNLKLHLMINDLSFELLGVPLLTRMFAEITKLNSKKYICNSSITSNPDVLMKNEEEEINLLILYERFIKMKFKIFFGKNKIENDGIIKILEKFYYKSHGILAIHEIFSCNILCKNESFNAKIKNKLIYSLENVDKAIGIVQTRGTQSNYNFTHKTFAEYFVADFLARCFTPIKTKKTFIEKLFVIKVVLLGDYKVVRKFLNLHFSNFETIPDVMLKAQKEYLWEYFLWTNILGETSLHVAAKERLVAIAFFILHNLAQSPKILLKLLSKRDFKGKTPLYVSMENNLNDLAEKIIDLTKSNETDLKKIVLSTLFTKQFEHEIEDIDKTKIELRHKTEIERIYGDINESWIIRIDQLKKLINTNNITILNLFENLVDYETSIARYAILAVDAKRNNFLHLAASAGHSEILMKMINYLGSEQINFAIFSRNNLKNTILLEAIINRHDSTTLNILKILKEKEITKQKLYKFILAKNSQGNCALHESIKIKELNIVSIILDYISEDETLFLESITMRNYKGSSPLHLAASNLHRGIVKKIIETSRKYEKVFEKILSTFFLKEHTFFKDNLSLKEIEDTKEIPSSFPGNMKKGKED